MLRSLSGLAASLLAISSAARGCEPGEKLTGSISPDGRYELCLERRPAGLNGVQTLVFRLHDRRTGRALLNIDSSFSSNPRDPDEGGRYWDSIARSSSVWWNPLSTIAAVDEYPVHSSGHVFLMAIRDKHAVRIDVPERKILNATGRHWSKTRLRVRKEAGQSGWLRANRLGLSLAVSPSASDPISRTYGDPDYEVVLEIHDRRATVVSVSAGKR